MMNMTNKEFTEYINKNCRDMEFAQAVEGFYMDSKNELESIKIRENREYALKEFAKRVELNSDGRPNIDEVELLDIYESLNEEEEVE